MHKVIDKINLHKIDRPEYFGMIISQEQESPSPVLWSVSFMY